ncbi:GNAT family N-acetyltransferase [Ferrimonas lipolytica]|uniref:GNAT family N-acetyltransferase n=1 Tax=Ferrimonas lipolytica TaxID=2724191 RepID=A0A6H1UGF0_9GAMM|nr:GNAT family N-acetyltransferase [Ferrimonas lipolytica]QIZ78161.1 GNAT family N-acetyltransferase [Ferrimonas lipolytica]
MTPQWLTSIQTPLASAFYKRCGSKEKAKADERVAVIRDNSQQIVASLRLRRIGGHWLLRALLVDPQRRQQGIALQLLQFVGAQNPEPIWCFPYPHLQSLYHQADYQLVAEAPEPILTAYNVYLNRQPLLLMCCNR